MRFNFLDPSLRWDDNGRAEEKEMDEKTAIGFILQKVNAMDARTGYGIGEPGMATIKNVAQQTANKAVSDFMQNRDPGPIVDLIGMMHAYGSVTDSEYNQLIDIFQKET